MENKDILEQWWEIKSVYDVESSLRALATTFDQSLYLSIINSFSVVCTKKLQTKKWQDTSMPLLAIYNTLITWYREIDWGNDRMPNPTEMTVSIGEENETKMKKFFVLWSRELLKILEKNMKNIVWNNIHALAKRQVIEHVFAKWYTTVYATWEDMDIIKESIEGFKTFAIE